AQFGLAQVLQSHVARSPETAFLAHREEKRAGWVGEAFFQERREQRHQASDAGAVVAAERRLAAGANALAFKKRLGAGAEGHGVQMSHEENARARLRAGKVDNEIAG